VQDAAAWVLSLAALGGAIVASYPLRRIAYPPTWLAVGHGLVAATGLVLLVMAALSGVPRYGQFALSGFILAAMGGFTLFGLFHLRQKPLPRALVIGHGLLALASLVLLWMSVCESSGD
jgi:hypothetical protein